MQGTIPDQLLEKVAEKFRILGDPTRLMILRALMPGERNVSAVVAETGQSQANVSKHLKMMADAGMVKRRKEGLQVFYQVGDPLIEKLCMLVCGSVLQDAESQMKKNCDLLESWKGQ